MPLIVLFLWIFLYPLGAFSHNPEQESLKQKIITATNILEQNQALLPEDLSPISQNDPVPSYQELLKMDELTTQLSQEIHTQVDLLQFFTNTLPYIYELQDLEKKQTELFNLFLENSLNSNQNQYQQERFNEDLRNIQIQRGQLNHEELSEFINTAKQEDTTESLSLKDRLKQMPDGISSAYDHIDQQKEQLLQQSYLFARLLCSSQAYRSSYTGDCVFILNKKQDLINFLDSLSPKRWQELQQIFKNTEEYQMYSRFFDPGIALAESLWILYNQEGVYDLYNQSVKRADFYRWMYFVLRDKARQGLQEELFSWEILQEKINQEQNRFNHVDSKEIDFLMQDLVISAEKDRLSGLLLEIENQYFEILNTVSIFFDVQLRAMDTDFVCKDLFIITNRQSCFQTILNNISAQEQTVNQLKAQRETMIHKIIWYAPLIIQNLQTQL